MVKFITNWLTSSVTIVTLSVAIEVAALIHLIKWELIRESRQRGFSHKKANELLQHGIKFAPIKISGKWYEIDTPEDLEAAKKIFRD